MRGLRAVTALAITLATASAGRPDPGAVCEFSRRPRGNPEWPEVGIFAQRAKDRPNRLGLCTCELVAVDGASIVVRGLDAVDGTPVLDVKPYMLEFGPREAKSPPPQRDG